MSTFCKSEMLRNSILYAFVVLGICSVLVANERVGDKTDTPIIGILAQEIAWHLDRHWPGVYESYIAASYVKFVEGGGARPVPIWIGKSREYYEDIMKKVNGVLLPGGGTWFNQTNGFAEAGAHIYDIAMEMNDNGNYFPLFGTCLGFELLLYLSNDKQEYRATCSSQRQRNTLNFTKNFRESRLFGEASNDILNMLQNEEVTSNFHSWCLTKQNLTYFGLDKDWSDLSYSTDLNGLEFVSSVEHKRYPFYGVQFHPEKNVYEWARNRNIPHTKDSIATAQYFETFLVNECRMNGNRFSGADVENQVLIYNFPATFTGRLNSTFEQCYLFESNVDYPYTEIEAKLV